MSEGGGPPEDTDLDKPDLDAEPGDVNTPSLGQEVHDSVSPAHDPFKNASPPGPSADEWTRLTAAAD